MVVAYRLDWTHDVPFRAERSGRPDARPCLRCPYHNPPRIPSPPHRYRIANHRGPVALIGATGEAWWCQESRGMHREPAGLIQRLSDSWRVCLRQRLEKVVCFHQVT